jgi:hypothetical protein
MQETKEFIADEILAESFNPDTSNVDTLDTRALLVRTAANILTAIESLDTERVEAGIETDIASEVTES